MRSRHVIYWPKFSYFPFAISTISTSSLRKILRLSLLDNFFFNLIRKEKLRQEKKRKQTKNFFLEIVAFARLWYAQPHPHTHTHTNKQKNDANAIFGKRKAKLGFDFWEGCFLSRGVGTDSFTHFREFYKTKRQAKEISLLFQCILIVLHV